MSETEKIKGYQGFFVPAKQLQETSAPFQQICQSCHVLFQQSHISLGRDLKSGKKKDGQQVI